jgi:imidazolonepropionase-like amidohydrolase
MLEQRMRLSLLFAAWAMVSCAQPIVLDTTTILDGKGGTLTNCQIVIEGGRILSIAAGKARATYDLRGFTVMPGWIDTHVHLNGLEYTEDSARPTENARLTLEGGFTTVQSVGAEIDKTIRDRIADGEIPGPRVLTSLRQFNDESGTPDAIRELVRKTKADGADLIKLFADDGISAVRNHQTMSDEQIQATCSEAKAQGLRTLVHALGAGAKPAILAGCTAIEHGSLVDDAALDLMAEHGTYFDPNFLVFHNYLDNRARFHFTNPSLSLQVFQDALDPTASVLQRARGRHVKIVLGTDAVAGAHGRNAEEFVYRVRDAHDQPMDAIVSATSMAAESLGLGQEIGTLAPGFQADLVATEGNPLNDISAVRRVVFVMKAGKVYKGPNKR